MRIGINSLFLVPGDVGGTEVYFRENLKIMVSDNQDDSFFLYTTRDNEEPLRQDLAGFSNVQFVRLPFRAAIRPIRIILEQTLLPWMAWRSKIDVLWSPGYTAPLFCACPQAVTIHDLQYKTHPDDVSFLERVTLDFLVKNACRVCGTVITVSEFSKNEVLRFNFAPEHKVVTIHEGVDPAFGELRNTESNCLKDLPSGDRYILCVAHSYPHKQIHLLVEAFGLLAGNIPHHLVLVGKPRRGETKVQESLGRLKDIGKIHRVSGLKYLELQEIYQGADLFVLPSQYEGFGLPILEAMLAGVPVVTTNQASLPEVGGTHAVYVRAHSPDALATAIMDILETDEGERSTRVEKGKEWARAFTWGKSASKTLHVLKRLVQENT